METAYFEGFDSGPKVRSIPARASGPRQLSKPKNALRAESPIPLVCDGLLALKSKKRLAICTARTYLHLKTCVKSTSLGQTPTVVFGTTNLESRIKGANFAFPLIDCKFTQSTSQTDPSRPYPYHPPSHKTAAFRFRTSSPAKSPKPYKWLREDPRSKQDP